MILAKLRILGLHLLILGVVSGAATAATLTFGRVAQARRLAPFPQLPVRIHYDAKASPIWLAMAGLPPDTDATHPRQARRAIRAITVRPADVALLAGGRVVRWIPTAGRSLSLADLAQIIADPSWISQPRPGVIDLRAALVAESGATVTVAPPYARRLWMADIPGVFLGAHHATMLIKSAVISSSRPEYRGSYRPFVLADAGSRLWIVRSRLTGLGWNWNDSYGVAWKSGSTGGATRSTFSGNYFGLYTGGVSGVAFTRNVISGNIFYGVDPHTHSSDLTIMKNTITGNGRHGLIFSSYVTASTVTGNIIRGNAANGIMMDEASTGNVIRDNTVTGNHGDGIVLSQSPANQILGNVIRGNRVGLRLTRTGSGTVQLAGNVISGNSLNAQGLSSTAGNAVESDVRVEWDADGLAVIWVLGAVLVTVTLMSLTSCLLGVRQAR